MSRPYRNPRDPNPLCSPAKTRSGRIVKKMSDHTAAKKIEEGSVHGSYDELDQSEFDEEMERISRPDADDKSNVRLLTRLNLSPPQGAAAAGARLKTPLKRESVSEETKRKLVTRARAKANQRRESEQDLSSTLLETRVRFESAMDELSRRDQEIAYLRRKLDSQYDKSPLKADIKPTKFDGSANVEDYLVQFASIAKFNHWDESQRVAVLLSKLEGEALKAATVLKDPSWDELETQLRTNFGVEQQELASVKLQNRLQKPKETLESLCLDIQKLTTRAFPKADRETRDRLAKDAFVNAIESQTLREKLRDKHLPTLKKSLEEARRLSTNIDIEKTRGKPSSSEKTPPSKANNEKTGLQEQVRRLQDDLDRLKKQDQRRVPQTKPKPQHRQAENLGRGKPLTCFECARPGHIAKYCPVPSQLVDEWIRQGVIPLPKNRQRREPQRTPFNPRNYPENERGQLSNGPSTPL